MSEQRRQLRVLVAGWPSFVHGEATAGDVLAMEAVRHALASAGIPAELAWSPVFRPGGLTLDGAAPDRYTHLVFCCGPLHGRQLTELHHRYPGLRRIAVGVSVTDPGDPAAAGFDVILPRDRPGAPPRLDLAAEVRVGRVPVAGVVLAPAQPEYGPRGRHDRVTGELTAWLAARDCARVPLDTRLDPRDWRHHATAAQLESVLSRLDIVVTTRLHGLVLALKNGVPALAVDPVAGGAKVSAQAAAWGWPAVIAGQPDACPGGQVLGLQALRRWWDWCLSAPGREQARAAARYGGARPPDHEGGGAPARRPVAPLTADLLRLLAPRD